jgi:hypothetical protein
MNDWYLKGIEHWNESKERHFKYIDHLMAIDFLEQKIGVTPTMVDIQELVILIKRIEKRKKKNEANSLVEIAA